jgi:predicted transcriptional regulator
LAAALEHLTPTYEAVYCSSTEEARFHAAVEAGREAAARGEFVPASEVWANVETELQA